jgi:hypothetical protein
MGTKMLETNQGKGTVIYPPSMNVENHFVDVENDMHIVTAIKVVFLPK